MQHTTNTAAQPSGGRFFSDAQHAENCDRRIKLSLDLRSTRAATGQIVFFTLVTRCVINYAVMHFTQTRRLHAVVFAAFATVYILWGSTFCAIAVAVQSIPPFLLIGVRSWRLN
jgi:hypothetical protein